jgi:hypothetical protein
MIPELNRNFFPKQYQTFSLDRWIDADDVNLLGDNADIMKKRRL